ncbi:MAG: family 10 glycosylhydrolase [Armatimonadetes bacterium]|nr:family 10 glycosylhydrolase [Armatimonadota bacterium]
MRSKGDVAETIAICRRNGVNAVFIVVWNNGLTTYPSTVLERYIGVKQSPVYKGFDPLGEFVRQGHQAGIKVHAWFEYGFSHHYGADEDVWAKKYPEWNGRTIDGKNLVKNGFAWWNALDLRPQKFLREIVLEVVQKYDIDGVQGDDRMPALPAEGGYDEQTLAAFHHETGSLGKPEKEDKTWIQWRCDRLSSFARAIYEDVKKAKKDCLVSWAPSIYPWSKDEYLQDWPTWLRSGCADFVVPQVYRYNAADYDATLSELRGQLSESDMHRVFPGMLTALGSGYRATPSFLAHMKQSNSRLGFKGECLFYFESLRHSGERACQAHFPMQKS